jgi:hypothetical protein
LVEKIGVTGEKHRSAAIDWLHYLDLQFLNNGIIIKTKIILLHAYVTSADLIYPAILVFLPPKTFILFVFPILSEIRTHNFGGDMYWL